MLCSLFSSLNADIAIGGGCGTKLLFRFVAVAAAFIGWSPLINVKHSQTLYLVVK